MTALFCVPATFGYGQGAGYFTGNGYGDFAAIMLWPGDSIQKERIFTYDGANYTFHTSNAVAGGGYIFDFNGDGLSDIWDSIKIWYDAPGATFTTTPFTFRNMRLRDIPRTSTAMAGMDFVSMNIWGYNIHLMCDAPTATLSGSTPWSPSTYNGNYIPGDYNGDGKMDVFFFPYRVAGPPNHPAPQLWLSNGSTGWNKITLPFALGLRHRRSVCRLLCR